jgi:MerR family transcriptional regulator, light-induced transcriptional regulator
MSTFYRSGAVARMLRMPVATLRVWERRYALTDSARSPSGQRQYSAADVQRLALLKQLSDLGHAIGQLAPLSLAELQAVVSTHASTLTAQRAPPALTQNPNPGLTWALTGPAAQNLRQRLERPVLRRLLGTSGSLPSILTDSGKGRSGLRHGAPLSLLVHVHPQLPDVAALPLAAAARHALLYRFGREDQAQRLMAAGVLLLCEPQPDTALACWLSLLLQQPASQEDSVSVVSMTDPPTRRWSDEALADFAGLSTTVACECPRHLAEIVMQLSHFEAYTASCEAQSAQSPVDAALHAELRRITATARGLFEQGLEQVARHEGLLPSA